MSNTNYKELDMTQARDVWLAFERLYPSVASNVQPADFAEKLKAAYTVIFSTGHDTPQPPCE